MTGVVLSGGKSSRMGTDKGLIQKDGTSWARIAFNKLHAWTPAVYVSVSREQFPSYLLAFKESELIADDTSLKLAGPVLGILSAHLKHPGEDLLVMACDILRMEDAPIQYLLRQCSQMPFMESYLFTNDNGLQPLMALYKPPMLDRILQQLTGGMLTNFSVKHLIDISKSLMIEVPSAWQHCFVNFNSQQDISTGN